MSESTWDPLLLCVVVSLILVHGARATLGARVTEQAGTT